MLIVFGLFVIGHAGENPRQTELFNFDWRFHLGDVAGAEGPGFPATEWSSVDLPHDFCIYGPFQREAPLGTRYGFRPLGIGWYRKAFPTPPGAPERKVLLDFEGVCRECQVWINGNRVIEHNTWSSPWRGFSCDITALLHRDGKDNLVAVRVDASKEPGVTWYNGGGIYRHVRLIVIDPIHVIRHGTAVITSDITSERATVKFSSEVVNTSKVACPVVVTHEIVDSDGRSVATSDAAASLDPGATQTVSQVFQVKTPRLWDTETPHLYRLVTRIRSHAGQELDRTETTFGIRDIRMTPDGLFLNGKRTFITGINIHHDLGCLGVAAFDRAIERRLRLLKDIGINGLRLSHNPHAPHLLDLCDQLGILVFDEAFCNWGDLKRFKFADSWRDDLTDFIRRDRNHPSVFIWSVGNQVSEAERAPDFGCTQFDLMRTLVKSIDPTRMVTTTLRPIRRNGASADFKPGNEADVHPLGLRCDVMSANYMEKWFAKDRLTYPNLIFITSECTMREGGRGAWYDLDRDHAVGLFYWGGIDYIGESNGWPVKCWKGGLIDWAGFRKPSSWVVQSLVDPKPMVHVAVKTPDRSYVNWDGVRITLSGLLSHWNLTAGSTVEVEAITNADEAELLLNNRSLGIKRFDGPRTATSRLVWKVAWEPGALIAIARKNGQEIARDILRTAGEPQRLRLTPDRQKLNADGQDLSHITVEVVDRDGVVVPNDERQIRFRVTGPGRNAGVQNSDVVSDEEFQADHRKAYEGRALLVIRSERTAGEITVVAEADGLAPSELRLQSQSQPPTP